MENQVKFKWISVSEKMPESMQEILFIEKLQNGKSRKHLGHWNKEHSDKGWRWFAWNSRDYELEIEYGSEITHWLELPPLPTV